MRVTMEGRKVVWILGAGFSAGLGGPLLQRLLSPASENDIKARYPDPIYPTLYGRRADYLRNLYSHGLGLEYAVHNKPRRGEVMWGNAEEFVDYLDTAAEQRPAGASNPHGERLKAIVNRDWNADITIDDLRATARHLIAAECCAFLEGVDPRREHWKPFRRWTRMLTPRDTIITFNYDRVLEILGAAQNDDAQVHGTKGNPFHIVLPEEADSPSLWDGSTPVLKLHGSVDWRRESVNGQSRTTAAGDPLFAIKCEPSELAIATPGPSKSREASAYRGLWNAADSAIKQAEILVFIGFRFPETDAEVRETILTAIGHGHPERLRVHIVLGYPGRDTQRLQALLDFAQRRRRLVPGGYSPTVHPLLGQDFLSVVDRGPRRSAAPLRPAERLPKRSREHHVEHFLEGDHPGKRSAGAVKEVIPLRRSATRAHVHPVPPARRLREHPTERPWPSLRRFISARRAMPFPGENKHVRRAAPALEGRATEAIAWPSVVSLKGPAR